MLSPSRFAVVLGEADFLFYISLNISLIADDLVLDCMSVISQTCPQLKYLGVVCLPIEHKEVRHFLCYKGSVLDLKP